MEDELIKLRAKLMSLIGNGLEAPLIVDLLTDVLKLGGGVRIELDDVRFTLIRRDGRFVLRKDDHRPSTLPPRR